MAVLVSACDVGPTSPDGACPVYSPTGLASDVAGSGSSQDLNAEWHDLGLIAGAQHVNQVVTSGGDVFVATDDGIWKGSIDGSGTWVRSGLGGHDVRALATVPGRDELLFAGIAIPDTAAVPGSGSVEAVPSFYRSEDGGATWTGYGEGLFDEARGIHESVEYIMPQPGSDGEVLYAGLAASTIARSTDGGSSWTLVKGELGGFGYACQVHIPADDPGTVFQGCEAPLDMAWIRAYDLSTAQAGLGEGCLIVDHDDISNRRPNVITSFPETPGRVFAGLEGALIEIRADGWDWVWRREASEPDGPYTYVKFVWVNPDDPNHIVFGGGDGTAPDRGGLYETFDGGEEVTPLDEPDGIDFTDWGVFAGTPISDGHDFVVVHVSDEGARVLKRVHTS